MTGPDSTDQWLTPEDRRWLLALARDTVERGLDGQLAGPLDPATVPAGLDRPGAAFVTLRRGGRLLGCIGTITPYRALADDVAAHAFDAAFRDPRLPPVTRRDAARMTVEVSVLGPLEPLAVHSRHELADALRPGLDGLWIDSAAGRATFLPSVWDQVSDVDDFLDRLWAKAGIAVDHWPTDLDAARYQVVEFDDRGIDDP